MFLADCFDRKSTQTLSALILDPHPTTHNLGHPERVYVPHFSLWNECMWRDPHNFLSGGGFSIARIRTETQPKRQSFSAGCSWDIRGPDVRMSLTPFWDVPDKTLCKAPSSVVSDGEWLGCPAIWVGMSVPGFGCSPGAFGHFKLYVRKLWADF